MSTLVDAIRSEIQPLQERLDKLREMERLALEMDGGGDGGGGAGDDVGRRPTGASPAADAPVAQSGPHSTPPVPAAGRPTARDTEAKIVHALMQRGGWMTGPQITQAAEVNDLTRKGIIQRLVASGKVRAEGKGRGRKFRLAKQDGFHTEARTKNEASKARNAKKVDSAISRVGLRDRVMKAIAADSGALTEDRLAQALGAHRDDIAEATGWLLERERVHLNEDGTYRRNGTREMAS